MDSVPAVLCAVALAECLTAAGDVAAAERLLSESVPVRPCRSFRRHGVWPSRWEPRESPH